MSPYPFDIIYSPGLCPHSHPLDVFLWDICDVFPLLKILPQKPVGVLIGSTFPRLVRSGKIKWDMIQLFAELNMLRKLFASIWSDRQVWLSPERFPHYLVYSSSGFALCLATKQISTLSVYQRNKASLALLSYYSICFPMTTNGAVFRAGRAFLNSMRYDKLPTTFLRTFL